MSFKVGQLVECIQGASKLILGKIYTVSYVYGSMGFIGVEEVQEEGGWSVDRFRPAFSSEPLHSTKASKNDQEKPDLSLIPYIALEHEARAFMVGEKKYGRYNYTKGHTASQLTAAMLRHITKWFEGEEFDPIDGQHHLGSVRACAAMILRQQELGTLDDNRFKAPTKKDEK